MLMLIKDHEYSSLYQVEKSDRKKKKIVLLATKIVMMLPICNNFFNLTYIFNFFELNYCNFIQSRLHNPQSIWSSKWIYEVGIFL